VSIGTYHLPFDRLVDWVDTWAEAHPEVSVLVQHGVSRPSRHAQNVAMIPHADLIETYAAARVLVLQGGAGGVMDARAVGAVPILVPRSPELNEVVDFHQLEFALLLREQAVVHVAVSEDELHSLLCRALAGDVPTRATDLTPSPGVRSVLSRLDSLAAEVARSGVPPAPRGRLRRAAARTMGTPPHQRVHPETASEQPQGQAVHGQADR
jgi:UDP-N-acetylglucosamine transferase subunit ALG13